MKDGLFDLGLAGFSARTKPGANAADIDSWEPGGPPVSTAKLPSSTGQWFFLIIFLTLAILLGRLIFLQGKLGLSFRQQAEQNRIRLVNITAPRGSIEDRYGLPVVRNVPDFSLAITPADVPTEKDAKQLVLERASTWSGLSISDIDARLNDARHRRTDPAIIVEHASYDQAISWSLDLPKYPGLSVIAQPTRFYESGPALAPVLGYVGLVTTDELAKNPELSTQSVTGKQGLEKIYQSELRGTDGQREIERDAFNQSQRVLTEQTPVPGNTLHLTIDRELQKRLYDAVAAAVRNHGRSGGAAVAIDPRNGDILALVSAPSYDNNWFVTPGHSQDISQALQDMKRPLLNRAVSGQYPSGSIIKPFIGVAAIAENVVTPATTILSTGGFKIGVSNFPDWKAGGHGVTNLAKAIAESVNTYFYHIGGGYQDQLGLGVDRIIKYLQAFGWGQKTHVDLPGEASGFLPDKQWREEERPTPWRLGDTYHLSIGQGDLTVTPLQVATAIASIANGGTVYQPRLVSEILDPQGKSFKHISPKVLNSQVADDSAFAAVREGMRQGVLTGSSRSLATLPVASGAKTGTAQFGNQGKTHAWHAAFAPYDQPTIALAVIIEEGGEGNAAALPVTRSVLGWYFSRPPTMSTDGQGD